MRPSVVLNAFNYLLLQVGISVQIKIIYAAVSVSVAFSAKRNSVPWIVYKVRPIIFWLNMMRFNSFIVSSIRLPATQSALVSTFRSHLK